MDIVLGVSMTPTEVRIVLVDGERADGITVDNDSFAVPAGATAPDQVIAAILGTRESAAEGGHRLRAAGVAWTDHSLAAGLSQALRNAGLDDVTPVSELHAAGALAQAIGRAIGTSRTALLYLESDNATLAVVRTSDGAVVRVASGSTGGIPDMVARLEAAPDPAEALFVVGSGVDAAALKTEIAACTALPVHAPEDGDLALARGAALAAANAPRFEATTVGLAAGADTAAGPTQMAAAGYMAPLGYSAVAADDDDDLPVAQPLDGDPTPAPEPNRFQLVGSALAALLVAGVVALTVSLAVVIRPTADQRPDPIGNAVLPSDPAPAPGTPGAGGSPALETIPAPIPVVQEAPRTVVVAPQAPARVPAPAAPAAEPIPAAVPAPAPAAPAPVPAVAPAPAPAPIVVPVPIVPLLPSILQPPVVATQAPRYPATAQTSAPSAPVPTTTSESVETSTATESSSTESSSTESSSTVPTPAQTSTAQTTAAPTTAAPTTASPSSSGSAASATASSAPGSSAPGSSSASPAAPGTTAGASDAGGSRQESGSSQDSPLWPLGE